MQTDFFVGNILIGEKEFDYKIIATKFWPYLSLEYYDIGKVSRWLGFAELD